MSESARAELQETDDDMLTLPIGIEVDGVRHRRIRVDELTGYDEELMSSPKYRNNPIGGLTAMLSRCIQEIEGLVEAKSNPYSTANESLVRSMYQVDRDYVLLQIRRMSFGDTMLQSWQCPTCQGDNEDEVNLSELDTVFLDKEDPTTISFELPKGVHIDGKNCKKGQFSFPRGRDTEPLAKLARRDPGKAGTAMMAAMIKNIEGHPADRNIVSRMRTSDRMYLNRLFNSSLPGTRMEVEVSCGACGKEDLMKVSFSNFFGRTPKS
jgi:hypothetical protein